MNKLFLNIYNLEDEYINKVEDKDITIKRAEKVRDVKSLISYAVGCMFGRYSLNKDFHTHWCILSIRMKKDLI